MPPMLQQIGWTVLLSILFAAGVVVVGVMAWKLVEEFKASQDLGSGKFLKILFIGGSIAGLCFGGGVFAVVRLMSAFNAQIGLG
ncbi:hypothetical protein [Mycobacteroides abscessus]|uniref:hypothetical protein n=1 Tax=Mycobacteroides abscessus TaxID=36809 RepID=UPI0010512659|nr:hypothetical protein [Mycobacteroides abscessus]